MPDYHAEFPVGTRVRIYPLEELERFKREWKYHHPLSDEQLGYAGAVSEVKDVGYYHGGDPLYTLTSAPGIWHEENLSAG
jgi:hypothetical protein